MIRTLVDLLGNFYARNDFANFEAIARSLLAAIPNDQVSLQFLGLVYYRTGRINDAIQVFDRVVRRRARAEIPAEQAASEVAPGDSAAALCYQEATRDRPELARAWYDVGTTLVELGKVEQALPAFRSALSAQPESSQAMLAIGQTALRAGDLASAEEGFSLLRAVQPNNGEAYQGLGQIYRKRRDFATARACFARLRLLRHGIDSLRRRRRTAE
jgi:tetratricopeptide (TPR) repeat protein